MKMKMKEKEEGEVDEGRTCSQSGGRGARGDSPALGMPGLLESPEGASLRTDAGDLSMSRPRDSWHPPSSAPTLSRRRARPRWWTPLSAEPAAAASATATPGPPGADVSCPRSDGCRRRVSGRGSHNRSSSGSRPAAGTAASSPVAIGEHGDPSATHFSAAASGSSLVSSANPTLPLFPCASPQTPSGPGGPTSLPHSPFPADAPASAFRASSSRASGLRRAVRTRGTPEVLTLPATDVFSPLCTRSSMALDEDAPESRRSCTPLHRSLSAGRGSRRRAQEPAYCTGIVGAARAQHSAAAERPGG